MIQYNSLRKKGFNFRIDKKLMKKKKVMKNLFMIFTKKESRVFTQVF